MRHCLLSFLFFLIAVNTQAQDDVSLTVIYDTCSVSFDISFCDLQINAKQAKQYNKKRVNTLQKLDSLKSAYAIAIAGSGNIDSILSIAENWHQECQNYLVPFVKDKKTFYFSVRYSKPIAYVRHLGNDTISYKARMGYEADWAIDTVNYILPATTTNSPFEFKVEVDSIIRKNKEFALHYAMYRQGFTQSKNTIYTLADEQRQLVLKHKADTCSLTAIPSSITIANDKIFIRCESSMWAYSYALPINIAHLSGFDYGVLQQRVNPFLHFLKTGDWTNFDNYRVPVLFAGEGLIRFARNYHKIRNNAK